MRYELSDYEWTAIKPMLPNKPRGVRRVNDRRVLNGIFWVLRSGAPWRDLPETYGPRTTCYNRFVRWRKAGVWDQIMEALAAGHDAAVQMIDTSVVRVHQHGACIADSNHQDMGRSRGGLTSKIHAVVDTHGLPVRLAVTPGEAHDNRLCSVLLSALLPQTMLLADRGYDADWIRELARQQGAWANIPPKRNRRDPICFSPYLYRARNHRARNLSSGSSTKSSSVGVSRPGTTNCRQLSGGHQTRINPHLAACSMNPRPSTVIAEASLCFVDQSGITLAEKGTNQGSVSQFPRPGIKQRAGENSHQIRGMDSVGGIS
jgi:transposase